MDQSKYLGMNDGTKHFPASPGLSEWTFFLLQFKAHFASKMTKCVFPDNNWSPNILFACILMAEEQNMSHGITSLHCPYSNSAQCVLCKVYFSAQLNKLRPILKLKKYYPIEHIFVPAFSSARKIHFLKF